MAILTRFAMPAAIPEPSDADAEAWSALVKGFVAPFAAELPQFYDPTETDTPEGLPPVPVVWPAFPASLLRDFTSQVARWRRADQTRAVQDEYCEWSVERDGTGKIVRVTFTTEVVEAWRHIARDPDRLLTLYRELVSPEVEAEDLYDANGDYVPGNRWNRSTTGRLAHLVQGNNTLSAAIDLTARATTLRRHEDGTPVLDRQELVVCSRLGNPFRNSDPQIAEVVNGAAASGAEITLLDPLGLYLDGLLSGGMMTPDGADAVEFWTIERGTPDHALRAVFAVPEERGYVVGDIRIGRRTIDFGAQVADKVRVRIRALAKPGEHDEPRVLCET